MNLRVAVTVIILMVFGKHAFSENRDSIVNAIFKLIYNEQYEKAGWELAANQQLDSFYFGILKIDLCWWEFVKSKNDSKGKELKELIKGFRNLTDNSEDENISRLIATSYQIRFELKRFNLIGASILRSEIKERLEEINKENLNLSENRLKLLDLYESLFLYFDNLINPLFTESKRINRVNALIKIEKYTNDSNIIVQTIACYFLGKIFLEIEKEPEKGKYCFELLSARFPQNSIFLKLLENCNKKS